MTESLPEPLKQNVTNSGGHMDQHSQNDWGSIKYDNRFDEYWVIAGSARQCLFYCPWCGEKLPDSKRDEWFDAIEALGLDPWHDKLPAAFLSDKWRNPSDPMD